MDRPIRGPEFGNVLCMMASPLAKGLFHRAISQSGGLELIPVSVAENYLDDEFKGDEVSSKEIVNQLFVNDGLAVDRDAARKLQESEPKVSRPNSCRKQVFGTSKNIVMSANILFAEMISCNPNTGNWAWGLH